MTVRSLPLFALALSVCAAVGPAPESDWNNVMQLPADSPVEVIHGTLKRSTGHLAGTTDDSVTVRTENGLNTIPRNEVMRVSVTSRSRGKRALIGMAIGAGAAAIAAAATVKASDIDIRHDLIIGLPMVLGGAAGAGIGAATGGPRAVYRTGRK